MTSFTITNPHKNIDNNGTLKSRILKEIANKLPFAKWHGIHTEEDPKYSIAFAGPEDELHFNFNEPIHFSALNKRFFTPKTKCTCCDCPFANSKLNLNYYDGFTDFDLAMRRIQKYIKHMIELEEDPGYDFLWGDTPVRIYQNFIQIGNSIVPMNDPYATLNRLSNRSKENIINIIINVSKTEIINKFE